LPGAWSVVYVAFVTSSFVQNILIFAFFTNSSAPTLRWAEPATFVESPSSQSLFPNIYFCFVASKNAQSLEWFNSSDLPGVTQNLLEFAQSFHLW